MLVDEIVRPFKMDRTVPSISRENRERVLAERSKYYRSGRSGKLTRVEVDRPIKWPDAFKYAGLEIDSSFLVNAGAGMVSTVLDLARFDIALDRNQLISESTKKTMFTPILSNSGRRLPYGLGWFIQDFHGVRLIWHYGYGGDYSSLILKVPEEEITLILLANSGGASAGFDLGAGHEPENVLKSPFAALFIESFTDAVLPEDCANLAVYPGDDWRKAESPEELGWSSEKLAEARAYSERIGSAAVMIVDNGVVVDSWGDMGRDYNCHSMRKSLLSALYGIYVDEGMIDLSKTLSDLGVDDYTPLTKTEKKATVADLIKARSGVYIPAIGESRIMSANRPSRGSHKPGNFWYYNNWDFNALGTIFDSETGVEDIYRAFKRNIADPVGMQDFDADKHSYSRSPNSKHPYYGFRMTTRDLARFGLLCLREGRWGENQIIPSAWIRESTASHSCIGPDSGYGYMWWTGVKGGLFPNVEVKGHSYYASGASGHWLIVLPFRNLVVVHRVDSDNPGNEVYEPQMGTLLWLILSAAGETETGEPPYMDWAPGRRLAGDDLRDVIGGSTLKARVAGRVVAMKFKRDGGLLFSLEKLVIPTTWQAEGDQLCLNLPSGMGGRFKAVKSEDTVSMFDLQGLLYFRFDYSRN